MKSHLTHHSQEVPKSREKLSGRFLARSGRVIVVSNNQESIHRHGPHPTHALIKTACPKSCSTLPFLLLLLRSHQDLQESQGKKEKKPTMSSFFEKKRFLPSMPLKEDLPISHGRHSENNLSGMRRRMISSISVRIQPLSSATSAAWAFRRTKSLPSISEAGAPLRRWWQWGWGWILAKKPTFAADLEMNEEETKMLGFQSRGTWKHIFYKVRSGIRELVRPSTLPTTHQFRYDSYHYKQNFDDGNKGDE